MYILHSSSFTFYPRSDWSPPSENPQHAAALWCSNEEGGVKGRRPAAGVHTRGIVCIIYDQTTCVSCPNIWRCHVCMPDHVKSAIRLCSPTPKVKWMKMGDRMPTRAQYLNYGKLLTISAAQENDGGKYMCTATNSAGEDVHYFDVLVEGKPARGK